MSEYTIINGQLYHHGIKGQKWGVRRFQTKDGSWTPAGRKRYSEGSVGAAKENMKTKKAAMKTANKEYSKSFDKAYNRAIGAYSPIKKHRENNAKRWEDAANKAETYREARKEYKQAKKDYKQLRKYELDKAYKEVDKQTTKGEKLFYNEATRQKAAKYVVDKNMSVEDAKKKANNVALRNTAVILGVYGALTVKTLYDIKK